MEYAIYITYRCNLRCPFCYVRKKLSSQAESISDEKIDEIIDYILKDKRSQGKYINFLGGEPLMDYKIIEKFIKKTKNCGLSYSMYTNGLLLNKTPLNVLKSFNNILVSIDGDKKAQEKYRGQGTFNKVIDNIKLLKPSLKALIIGRITATAETNIFKSVKNLLKYTDAVYWQIVNQPKFEDAKKFINQYKINLQKLFNFWLTNLKKGKVLNIIPFQAVAASVIFDYPKDKLSFRCGAGTKLKIIDMDGNIYWCDEHIGNKKGFVGNIISQPALGYKKHTDLFNDCKICHVSNICRGRCRRCLEEYSDNQIRNYCQLTKSLIEIVNKRSSEIKNILTANHYTLKQFYSTPHFLTEEIP